MSQNISSSSSQEKEKRGSRYECPADFVPLQYSCSEKCVLERGENTELWLIKAPARFKPSSLADLKVSLSGLEMIQSTDASPQIYSVLSSHSGPTDLHLLSSSGKKHKASPCASGFAGIISISESYGDCSGNQSPIPVPAAPAPSFPSGLKQRFQPFGSSTAAHVSQSTTSSSPLPPKKAKLESEETKDQSKKKKKKKKEKHIRDETIEVAHIKQEEISYECGEQQVPEPAEEDGTAERKKKKKIKKEKERMDTQDEVAIDTSLITKQEPMDTSFGDSESSAKKKKKKKKKAQAE
ncbi:CD3e molecule, epsilon associated protein [Pangasianodon hypophthalmus]|uniref:CD3e molecule, epsilon associated protein n=1 Tax=Pangasianodon hypophthalmus TaxID=310915 RepID=UPI000EFE5085|nr:CD3e molecule, epsilon associated protein [Pangasianodon hypophthalmus]